MRNNPKLTDALRRLGLNEDEATVFLCLVDAPRTLLEVSRATHLHRSNVYRIADNLAQKGIVHEVTTDNDRVLAAADPQALELLVVEQECAAAARRADFSLLLPLLQDLSGRDNEFAIKTYSGVAGVKQMLWNELKTSTEVLILSCGSLDLETGRQWAEKERAEIIRRGIFIRSIENLPVRQTPLSAHDAYTRHYNVRYIAKETLHIMPEIAVYDTTTCIYNSWRSHAHIGTEIKNPLLASFMRQIFEHYWQLATPPEAQ